MHRIIRIYNLPWLKEDFWATLKTGRDLWKKEVFQRQYARCCQAKLLEVALNLQVITAYTYSLTIFTLYTLHLTCSEVICRYIDILILFTLKGLKFCVSEKISQDPPEKSFGN